MTEPGEGSIDAELQVPIGEEPHLDDDASSESEAQLERDGGPNGEILVDPDVLDQLPATD